MTALTMEFEPNAANLLARQVPRAFRLSAYFALLLALLGLAWASLGRLDVTVSAPAVLRPIGETISIQATMSGTVSQVNVRDGEHVQAGQPLIQLRRDDLDGQLAQLSVRQTVLKKQMQHLATERANLSSRVELTRRMHQSRIGATEIALARAESEHKQRQRAAQAALDARKAELDSRQVHAERLQYLARQNAAAKVELDEAGRQLQVSQAEYDKAKAELPEGDTSVELARQELKVAQDNAGLATLEAEQPLAQVERQLADLQGESSRLRQETAEMRRKSNERTFKAPVSGSVIGLKVTHPGHVLVAGDVVASIVPDGAELQIEAQLADSDMAFVRPGQVVAMHLASLPSSQYGTVEGEVVEVSRDAVGFQDSQTVFRVRCRLKNRAVFARGQDVALQPGMSGRADIVTSRQTLLSLLAGRLKNWKDAI